MGPIVRHLGVTDYTDSWRAMQRFTDSRTPSTPDELWFLEHRPVFTLGLAGRPQHLLRTQDIPVVRSDRGGQVTYHGPGQLTVYLLLDLRRRGLGVRALVELLEQSLIDLLASGGVSGERRDGAPGVYVRGEKVGALGLRVRRGCSYHGLALNVRMSLEPFTRIDPCGYPGLSVTQLSALGLDWDMAETAERLRHQLLGRLAAGPSLKRSVRADSS